MKLDLNAQEIARYNRQIILPEIGLEGQKKLKKSRVLVVGAGGLGSPILYYLAAAGVGTLGIIDFDVVTLSNLNRQILYSADDIGMPKVKVAKSRIQKINPDVHVDIYQEALTSQNAQNILAPYDIILDGSDNFPTRYLVNDACILFDKPLVYGAVFRYEGHVSMFNSKDERGEYGPTYRDLFPVPPPPESIPNCSESGVLGVLPGIIGTMQALEAIKWITGAAETLRGKVFLFDARNFLCRSYTLRVQFDRRRITELIDYDQFCNSKSKQNPMNDRIKSIDVEQLAQWQKVKKAFQLIDVREPHEYRIAQIGGELIPMGEIPTNVQKIKKDRPVVVMCRSGQRSAQVIQYLQLHHAMDYLYNLEGGILAYADKIDPTLTKY